RLIVDDEDCECHGLSFLTGNTFGNGDYEFRVLPRLGFYAKAAFVLLHHDFVTQRQSKSCARSSRLRREERLEYPLLYGFGHTVAVILDSDLDAVANIF